MPSLLKRKRISLAALLLLIACSRGPLETIVIQRQVGGVIPFEVEIADSDSERSRGLMRRKNLPAGQGMLFLFPADSISPFWMKDTPIALDLLFIGAAGVIVDLIERTTPFSEIMLYSRSPFRKVLEIPAGSVALHGIRRGDLIILKPTGQ